MRLHCLPAGPRRRENLCLNYLLQPQTAVFNTVGKIKKYISEASVTVVTSMKMYYPCVTSNFNPQQLLLLCCGFLIVLPFVCCALNESLILFKRHSMWSLNLLFLFFFSIKRNVCVQFSPLIVIFFFFALALLYIKRIFFCTYINI